MNRKTYPATVETCWKCQGEKSYRVWAIRKDATFINVSPHKDPMENPHIGVPADAIMDRTTVQCDACQGRGYRINTVDVVDTFA